MQLEKQQKLHMAAAVMTAAALDPSVSNSLYFQEEEEQRHEGKEEEDPQSNRRRGRTKPSQTPRPCMPTSSYARLTAAGLGAVEPLFTTGHAYWQMSCL
ncbi:hypothetical protein CSUI_001350 [Cystoisospora suis]|uniref:Uncharacterized protein n=1 Tax=Cystoisospora suis TaxID=483139 RepID=A0A2C6L900_9APIC|nr:hypothetical protein CSUI_001350 [Cystoisospora suis]